MSSFTSSDVRNELGSPSESVISDTLLDNIVADENTLLGSATRAAKIIYRKFSLKADKDLGDLSIDYQKRAQLWKEIIQDLEKDACIGVTPFAGGISISDKNTRDDMTDETKGFFDRSMFDYFGEESSI